MKSNYINTEKEEVRTYLKLNKELAYKTIVTSTGNAYIAAIVLLEELIFQYKLITSSQGVITSELPDGWFVNYPKLKQKINYNYSVVRDTLKILEKKHHLINRKRFFGGRGSSTKIYFNLENIKNFLKE